VLYYDHSVIIMNSSVMAKPRQRAARREARKLVADFRRISILDAAREVFSEHGYEATTMDLIATAAGVAKGTLYLYYPAKAAIYSAAVMEGLRELANLTAAVLESGLDIREVLRSFLLTRLRYFETHADFFRIYSSEVGNLGGGATRIREEYLSLYKRQTQLLEHVLKAAVRSKQIRKIDARAVAAATLDVSHGLVVRHVRDRSQRSESDVETVIDLLWRGLEIR
jgi:TetR/AcrR family transcriptional regulator